jgi:hypothetical protein
VWQHVEKVEPTQQTKRDEYSEKWNHQEKNGQQYAENTHQTEEIAQ